MIRSLLAGLILALGTFSATGQTGPATSPADHQRAGNPTALSRWARPSDTGRYGMYQVGGGSVNFRRGELPEASEGTWGWDYFGGHFKRRVDLLWWHGQRNQGGTGAYKTDGPKLLKEE